MKRTAMLITAAALVTACGQPLPQPTTPDACHGKYCIMWSPNGVDAAVVLCAGSAQQLETTIATLSQTFPKQVTSPYKEPVR